MGRTNIDIDDELMAAAMSASGLKTKKAVVEEGLRIMARRARLREAIDNLAGIGWDDGTTRLKEIAEYGSAYRRDE